MKKYFLFVLICFMLTITSVGVFSATFLKLSITGNLQFLEYEKYVYVEKVEIKNYEQSADGSSYVQTTQTIPSLCGKYYKQTNAQSTINLAGQSIASNKQMTVEITMVSLVAENVGFEIEMAQVQGLDVVCSDTMFVANTSGNIKGGTKNVATITITNTTASVITLTNSQLKVSFKKYNPYSSLPIVEYDDVSDIYFSFDASDAQNPVAKVTGYNWENRPSSDELQIPARVRYNNVVYTVTEIRGAFSIADNFVDIIVPKTVNKITGSYCFGELAFGNLVLECTEVEIDDGVFDMCLFNNLVIKGIVKNIGSTSWGTTMGWGVPNIYIESKEMVEYLSSISVCDLFDMKGFSRIFIHKNYVPYYNGSTYIKAGETGDYCSFVAKETTAESLTNITLSYNSANNTAVVTYINAYDEYSSSVENVVVPLKVIKDGVEYTVISINDNAISYCEYGRPTVYIANEITYSSSLSEYADIIVY